MITKWLTAAVSAYLWLSSPLQAEIRALLVGVSDYDEASDIPDLRGPKNDVTLMQDVLQARGATDIIVLADGVDGGTKPTLAAIETGFADLTARAQPDDLVYVHLSGHGTRQPDLSGDETDGLDEVFLPADSAKVPSGASTIPNSLTDDLLGELIINLRATGADVWVVMDSCHSGSGTRSLSGTTAERNVDPNVLGVDISQATAQSGATPPPSTVADAALGGYLAFYATRSNDVAREGDFSDGTTSDQWFGLFTAALAARLENGQALSYRQLFQGILSDMNKGRGFGAGSLQTPLWEGNLIDASVFGGGDNSGTTRYLTSGDRVEAGLVHGLQVGSLLALFPDVADSGDVAPLGYAQAEEVNARSSYLRPVATDCQPQAKTLCDWADSLPSEARFAQVEVHPANPTVRFSPILDFETGAPLAANNPTSDLLQDGVARAVEASGIPAEITPDKIDIRVTLRNDSLWFGPVTQLGADPVGLEVPLYGTGTPDLLPPVLRILRAERLARILDSLDGGGGLSNPLPLDIDAERFDSTLSDLASPGQRIQPQRECRPVFRNAMQSSFDGLDPLSDVKQCDVLRFSARGNRDGQRDVNRIHIDSQYCINVAYELVEGKQSQRKVGDEMVVCSDCPGDVYSAGQERLYVLVSDLEENAEALNLTGLVENCDTGTRSVRTARGEMLREFLQDAGQAGLTRGNMGMGMSAATGGIWVQSYRWRVLPRTEAFRTYASQ
ncbi:Caspase domain protein [Falsiruegeria litorea R37]|uniref:Caspase domain protein n=1 Tax=Falsiruegeria litorea R37 TaxID=1200284 RepID=A0A1Y5SQF7_9RHOB|nr:caspase family protein [Falsiruegeria litorea]SLN42929.1 Caspase domain protein [Falsiruegeria litorea R37]